MLDKRGSIAEAVAGQCRRVCPDERGVDPRAFVLAYIAYCWYKMDRKKLTTDEFNNTDHKY